MALRKGHTYRIYDLPKRWVIALDPESRGGHFSPRVSVHHKARTVLSVPLPYLSFARAYRFRKLGALRVYALIQRAYYGAFNSPTVNARLKAMRRQARG